MNHRYPRARCLVLWLVLPLIVLGSGCVANPLQSASPENACQQLVTRLVRETNKANVVDAQAQPIQGFPLFRVDRFHAAATDLDLATDDAKIQWLDGLAELGSEALIFELARLPPNRRPAKASEIEGCVQQRKNQIMQQPRLFENLRSAIEVRDNYSRTRQILGLYALTSWPVKRGVAAWHEDTAERYAIEMSQWAKEHPLNLYHVAADFMEADIDQLAMATWVQHAPALLVQQQHQDQIGHFRRQQDKMHFDSAEATAYVMKSKTRFQGETLEQLNYLFWFEGRAASSVTDILAGKLDGLLWRVTLDVDGEPLIYDSIHPCGCYHLFFPTARLGRKSKSPKREPALIPQLFPAPLVKPLLRVSTTSHYIEGVSEANKLETDTVSRRAKRYKLAPYDQLRAMGGEEQSAISLFNNNGLVDGTQRLERFMLWMSGIKSPGAMRQWGHHATAFFGRRHFDDADLLDSEFCRVGDAGCKPMKTIFD